MKIISRAAAKRLGLTFYYTGKRCCHGHRARRYVSKATCIRCLFQANLRYQHSPKGKAAVKRAALRYLASPKGKDQVRRYQSGPLYKEARRRHESSPLGRERTWRYRRTEKYRALQRRWLVKAASPEYLARRRERYLDQALDMTRDDFDPVRAARLLALWNARQ